MSDNTAMVITSISFDIFLVIALFLYWRNQ
jgi:hypothetical protein